MINDQTRHLQTPEARRLAAESQRRRLAELPAKGTSQVFVVRFANAQQYSWEIRKFGGLVLNRSETAFGTQLLAFEAGRQALAELSMT